MPTFKADELVAIGVKIFVAAGVRESTATEVMESLVLSNLVGMDSHGMVRIGQYMTALKSGVIVPDAECEVVRETEVTVADRRPQRVRPNRFEKSHAPGD